jgi:hypothetical protein
MADQMPEGKALQEKFRRRLAKMDERGKTAMEEGVDLRPSEELEVTYVEAEGKGYVQYVQGRLEDGDLSEVITRIKMLQSSEGDIVAGPEGGEEEEEGGGGGGEEKEEEKEEQDDCVLQKGAANLSLLGISIHSCGNLTHHALRSLILNPAVRAVAIVGCCYNLATERLGPPQHRATFLRPSLQPLNGRAVRESERCDPHGFPMSRRMCECEHGQDGSKEKGIRLNITARMMACQAMDNWSEQDSDDFFTRHFYRAVLQRMFLDRGIVSTIRHGGTTEASSSNSSNSNSMAMTDVSTDPVILGSLAKTCYGSFRAYVRGAVRKLLGSTEFAQHATMVRARMGDQVLSDEEIDAYEARFAGRRRELSAAWSLMAFSAQVAEALMVTDRWQFLREQEEVGECWVETVFEYGQSPRNMAVVGIKREREEGEERMILR